eukprot:scaffold15317_cov43-Phaeocystis_antarctica.AAC.1
MARRGGIANEEPAARPAHRRSRTVEKKLFPLLINVALGLQVSLEKYPRGADRRDFTEHGRRLGRVLQPDKVA